MRGLMTTVATLMLIAASVSAQGPMGWGPGGGGGPMGGPPGHGGMGGGRFSPGNLAGFRMLARALDLTDVQVEEVEEILTSAREDLQELREGAETPEPGGFVEMFTSPDLTVSDLEDAAEARDAAREAAQDVIFQAIVDIHGVLTDEQLAELAELVEERRGGGPGFAPMGGGGPPGGGPPR